MGDNASITFDYTLYNGMNTEDKLFRVPRGSTVHFTRDTSLIGLPLKFFINYPSDSHSGFKRDSFIELKESKSHHNDNKNDCFDSFFALENIGISGSFHFQYSSACDFVPDVDLKKIEKKITGSGYLIVDPKFSGAKINLVTKLKEVKEWDLSGVVMQTYLPKCLGHFRDWDSRLTVAAEGNYNMIHFTPVQELGYSRSAYSLRDQLRVNPEFTSPQDSKQIDWPDIKKFIEHLENDKSILSMTDLVFNHTSNDSPWIHEDPQCAYNVVNSPHLAPAYLMDHIIWRLTLEASDGSLAVSHGIPQSLGSNKDGEMHAIRSWLDRELYQAKLHEFFQCNVDQMVESFKQWLRSNRPNTVNSWSDPDQTHLTLSLRCHSYQQAKALPRLGASINFSLANRLFAESLTCDDLVGIEAAADHLRNELHRLNCEKEGECESHLNVAINNVLANVDYRFYASHGLRLGKISKHTPLMSRYFYHPVRNLATTKEAEQVLYSKEASRIMAFNGWVMNDNPLNDFAQPSSNVYLRRELIAWGDSVKLRYGNGPSDCPVLWKHMADYAELTASIFHAVRLDNCHSTPLHVGQYMLDRARAVRPNLYVVAELFTSGEQLDNIFINKLGINSLIRECLAYPDCKTMGSHLYRYGVARPAGAFIERGGERRKLYPSVAHALLYDQTHDNPSVVVKHSPYNALPLSALCASVCCASGTTRGYDELVPHNIDVVNEERPYASWRNQVDARSALVAARGQLNELHQWLTDEGFTETFVDQVNSYVIAITRICPKTCESVLMVTHTAFHPDLSGHCNRVGPIELGGTVNRLLFEMRTHCDDDKGPRIDLFKQDPKFINGLTNIHVTMLENVDARDSRMFNVEQFTNQHGVPVDRLHFYDLSPGSVVVVSVRISKKQEESLASLHNTLANQFISLQPRRRRSSTVGLKAYAPIELPDCKSQLEPHIVRHLVGQLDLVALNRLLFRCEAEERADGLGLGCYQIPQWGSLCYCGFQSIVQLLNEIRPKNDLGHPLCSNLRQGDWFAGYLTHRLSVVPANAKQALTPILAKLGKVLQLVFAPLKDLPRYLVPSWFELLISQFYTILFTETINMMAGWIGQSSVLVKNLAIASLQFYGYLENCQLPPPGTSGSTTMLMDSRCSLAAGLPHFAEGMWRCWGRDTFIALRGCLLLTGRFKEAGSIILSYASLLRHGLIPNLTGDGKHVHPRYNCRDAVWYWLYAIVCYEEALGDSRLSSSSTAAESILSQPVHRQFPSDDAEGWPSSIDGQPPLIQPLHEVMQEALQRHFDGIDFVERNHGPRLDEQMTEEGFRVTANIDSRTGFPRGGNSHNCGTWMDKMGSSAKAGNKGKPATPRDGSAVELVGLAYAVVDWLARHQSVYPHSGLSRGGNSFWPWANWAALIKASFEPAFWIPSDTRDPALEYNKGAYRDCAGSSHEFTDNQLRPNFLVAMVVAPDLFKMERAWRALELARARLVGPLGMRTLAPNDMAYRGNYHNDNDSDDYHIAKGFNYHQGPEWLWPTGFYLRARLLIARRLARLDQSQHANLVDVTVSECQNKLACLNHLLTSSAWFSLPELTNANGEFCSDSCAAQAWSVGCTLEACYDLLYAP